ncbi:MAG: putative lipase, partial [Nocardioides sp.]|nr:putative lipase [Nocardioides sp.]
MACGLDNAPVTFHRYVALGDSFTEGVGDPDQTRPNGLRGWADRVA